MNFLKQDCPQDGHFDNPLDKEYFAHLAVAESFVRNHVTRESYQSKLNGHISSSSPFPLVLIGNHSTHVVLIFLLKGEKSSGKSALLAKSFITNLEKTKSNFRLFVHFVGASEGSGGSVRLMHRIMSEVQIAFKIAMEMPQTEDDIIREFPLWLRSIPSKNRFVIFIDGVEKLDKVRKIRHYSRNFQENSVETLTLRWLPELPSNIRIILSSAIPIDRNWPHLTVEPLEKEEKSRFANHYLAQYGKQLSMKQNLTLSKTVQTAQPAFLAGVLDEVCFLRIM
jgi:hypothetical protein